MPTVRIPTALPKPCPDDVIQAALGRADPDERLMLLLAAGWSAHSMRHRYATVTYAVARDLLTVQQLLGHSKPETTMRYTALPADALRASARHAALVMPGLAKK